MSRKKIEVVELNKKEKKIVLEETKSPLLSFWRKNYFLLLIVALLLSLTILSIGVVLTFKNILVNEEQIIKNVSIETTLTNYIANITLDDSALSEDTAVENFLKSKSFKGNGEVILVKTIDNDKFTIKYYSDGTATRYAKAVGTFTRIKPLSNGSYGINDDGLISANANTSVVTVKETKNYAWGKVTYYNDGSAEVSNADINIYVRNSDDINENYISNNKVSYVRTTKNVGSTKFTYYNDGTIEVVKNNQKYLVRDENDISISGSDVIFINENSASVYKTVKTSDGMTIDYYQDGGAIIRNGNKSISVRKSNSIKLKNNKIVEIVDNTYVEVSNARGNVTYYTNGAAVIEDTDTKYYIPENSDIKYKYQDGQISSIPDNKETLSNETTVDDENVKIFEQTAVVTTKDYINIIPKEKVIFDTNGKIKKIDTKIVDDPKEFQITNNTNERIKYRIVIEESSKTNLDTQYIRYQLSTSKTYIYPSKLKKWTKDEAYEALKLKTTNYILVDGVLEPLETDSVSLMFWTDYDTIPNSMQNKYFYGTIKVYAWSDEETIE